MTRLAKASAVAAAQLALALPALAHPGHGGSYAVQDGILHPLLGIDHLLAMVAVGILAWRLGGRAVVALPVTFLAVMAIGAGASFAGLGVGGIEPLIIASLVVLGLAIAADVRPGVLLSMAVVGVFAFAHGHAHGAEVPVEAGFAGYAIGFLAATAVLHASGIGLGMLLTRHAIAVRTLGALIAIVGLGLAAG